MAKAKLSKSVVEKLKPADADTVVWDSDLPGFGVRVKASGAKSYVVQYRNRKTGASRRRTLGPHGPLLSFHQARAQARMMLADALRGQDPVAEDRAIRTAPTVADLAADYLDKHAIPKKRPRSVANDRSMLDSIVLPKLGKRKVAEVQARDIAALHAGMKATPYRANRVLALLSKMFSLATAWGWRGDNPVKGIERFAEAHRERWLSDEELRRLMNVLAEHSNQRAANAVRLQLLTGARIGEVLNSRWSDIDFQRAVWTKPSHHTKQKKTEHLPLSAPALALLAEMRKRDGANQPHLFPGEVPGKPLQRIKKFWRDVTERAGLEDYRLHDNRHTHASHLVSSGLSLEIVGKLLGHTNPLTTRRYAHLADDPLRAAAERFGSKLKSLRENTSADVVPLPSQRS